MKAFQWPLQKKLSGHEVKTLSIMRNRMLRYKLINVEQKTNDEIFQNLIEFIGKNIGQIFFAKKYVTNYIY